MARVTVYVGHYGSGKTEICINAAFRLAAEGRTPTLVDLDIVNPYFRSGERRGLLEAAGVRVVAPTFEGTTVDVPALPAQVQSVFANPLCPVVFDAGGDPSGAAALGRYKPWFDRDDTAVLCVVNTCRPFTGDAGEVAEMVRALEARSRLTITGLVNNSNLAEESTPGLLLAGQRVVEEAAGRLGIPVAAICGLPRVLSELPDDFRGRYRELLVPLTLYMRPGWLEHGV